MVMTSQQWIILQSEVRCQLTRFQDQPSRELCQRHISRAWDFSESGADTCLLLWAILGIGDMLHQSRRSWTSLITGDSTTKWETLTQSTISRCTEWSASTIFSKETSGAATFLIRLHQSQGIISTPETASLSSMKRNTRTKVPSWEAFTREARSQITDQHSQGFNPPTLI